MTVAVLHLVVAFLAGLSAQGAPPSNPVAAELRSGGWTGAGTPVVFPAPRFVAGQPLGDERAALVALAGSERGVAELTRDSVSAPFVLRTSDVVVPEGVVRRADLWFVVHADLQDLDPGRSGFGVPDGQTSEAGNMRFTVRRLRPEEIPASLKEGPAKAEGNSHEWYVHVEGRLLDRIQVEATDRIVATETRDGWEVAFQTDPRFDASVHAPNRWSPLARLGATERAGEAGRYAGGAGTVSVHRLQSVPGALLVEAHFAFFEPRGWFEGAAILRSKIGLVSQDRVRALRRELAKSRPGRAPRSSGTGGPTGD